MTPVFALIGAIGFAAAIFLGLIVWALMALWSNDIHAQDHVHHFFMNDYKLWLIWGCPITAFIGALLGWLDCITQPRRLLMRSRG